MTTTKSGTSGYFTSGEFNDNLYGVQYSILSTLCDNYENNQKVSDALSRHIKPLNGTSQSNGSLFDTDINTDLPDYYRAMALSYVSGGSDYPSYKMAVNEIAMYMTSPIRKADITKQRTLWYMTSDNIYMLPKQSMAYSLIYCKKPLEAKIAFTTAENEDNDYLVVDATNTVDIDFPEGLFNLFLYYMLEKLGVEQKTNLILEYSQLGINRTLDTDLK